MNEWRLGKSVVVAYSSNHEFVDYSVLIVVAKDGNAGKKGVKKTRPPLDYFSHYHQHPVSQVAIIISRRVQEDKTRAVSFPSVRKVNRTRLMMTDDDDDGW